MSVRAVLFDLDGTLVDSNEWHVRAWHEVFSQAGHDVNMEAIRGQIGKGGDKLVPALIPDADDKLVAALSTAHGDWFAARYLDKVAALPGAAELVRRVKTAGKAVILASSAGQGDLDHYLDLLGVRDAVDAATTIDDVGESKPAPDIFSTALQKAGVAAGEAVAVGDSPFDGEGARHAGIRFVAVRSGGFDDRALTEAGAVAIYDDAAAILAGFNASPLA